MGWHESILEEGRMPTRHELDPVSPNNPVFIPRGGHVVTVNTKALELAGITKDTPNPEGGIIVRDDKGEATGMLLQNAANLVRRILPPPPANMAELLDRRDARPQLLRHRRRGRAGRERAADGALSLGA